MSLLVSRSLLVGCLLLGFAVPARAATLGFTGSITFQIAALPPIVVAGSGSASVNGSGPAGHLTGLALQASPFATTGLIAPVTDPAAFPIMGVDLTVHNATGAFAGSGGSGFGGIMPLLGVAKVCLFGACGTSGNLANLSVPLSVLGQGGIGTAMGIVNVTVVAGAWTTGTAAVGTITMMGGVAPLSNTAAPSGMVTLVTPALILTSIGAAAVVPTFGIMTLHFVPEPGTLLLLCMGVGAFGIHGRKRMIRKESMMSRRLISLIAIGWLFGATGQAQAASLGFTGSVAIQIAILEPVEISGSGVALVNGSGPAGHLTGLALPSSPFATTGLVAPVTDPAAFPIMGVNLTMHNGPGAFAGSGGSGFGGIMPLLGVAKVCLFGECGSGSNIQNLSVPLSVVGAGGFATVVGAINMTVFGAPWTTGTAVIGNFTSPITAMGGVAPLSNTAAPSGSVALVTPIFISTNIGSFAVIPAFAFQTLHFVPEPGTLVLLCAGVGALCLHGRRRTRR